MSIMHVGVKVLNYLSANTVKRRNVMVCFHCQLDWIWSHLGDTLMGVSGEFLEFLTEVKKEIHAEWRWHHPLN